MSASNDKKKISRHVLYCNLRSWLPHVMSQRLITHTLVPVTDRTIAILWIALAPERGRHQSQSNTLAHDAPTIHVEKFSFYPCSLALTRCFQTILVTAVHTGPCASAPHHSCLFHASLSLVSGWTATSFNPTLWLMTCLSHCLYIEKFSFYRFLATRCF